MSNVNTTYDVDDALASWERIKAEEAEEHKRKAILKEKETLPFSEPLAIEICERISSGELSLKSTSAPMSIFPTVRRVTQWLRENSDFSLLYKDSINTTDWRFSRRRSLRSPMNASHVTSGTWCATGGTVRVLDGDTIARAKLRVELRLKHLRAYKPSLWGEQSTLNVKTDPHDVDNMTGEELERKIRELEEKDEIVKEPRAA